LGLVRIPLSALHSGEHGAIGIHLLASGSGQHECLQHSKSTAMTRQSRPLQSATVSPTSPSPSSSGAGSQSWHYLQGYNGRCCACRWHKLSHRHARRRCTFPAGACTGSSSKAQCSLPRAASTVCASAHTARSTFPLAPLPPRPPEFKPIPWNTVKRFFIHVPSSRNSLPQATPWFIVL
jgi:hypothetical protein